MKAVVFLLIIAVAYCSAKNLRLCHESEARTYLGGTSFEVSAQLLQRTIKYVQLPNNGGAYPYAINCIIVTDQLSNQMSGEVVIVDGGLSFNYTNFKFVSNINLGLNYKIDLYRLSDS